MLKHRLNLSLTGLFAALAILSSSTATVLALPSQASSSAQDNTTAGSDSGTRLTAVKLKVCQNREAAIDKILDRIVTRGQNQLDLFSTIAQRVENFATTKNLTVTNYSQLLANLQADKTKASSDLAAMKANNTLDCSTSDPKGMVNAFLTDLHQEISDLKTYKTDVKNLIVAVKSAAGSSTSSQSNSTAGGQ